MATDESLRALPGRVRRRGSIFAARPTCSPGVRLPSFPATGVLDERWAEAHTEEGANSDTDPADIVASDVSEAVSMALKRSCVL